MHLLPEAWHRETWICSLRGHAAPAADAARVRPADDRLGVAVAADRRDGERFARCLRCDGWFRVGPPAEPRWEVVPPFDQLELPRRGRPLRDAVLLRIVALERAAHSVMFTLLAIVLAAIETEIGGIRRWATGIVGVLRDDSGDHLVLDRWLDRLARLDRREIGLLLAAAIGYAVIEGVESWALWTERRWGEYLTVIATAGFLPFEIIELTHHVTVFKVGALAVNIAVVIWLVWAKHLFGLRGGESTIHDALDWEAILDHPTPADLAPMTGR